MGRELAERVAGRRRGLRDGRRRPRRTAISSLAWDGPAERLDLTENAQPALLATSIAILSAMRERWAAAGIEEPQPAFAAGHSMGQYSALVAAGASRSPTASGSSASAGRLMQASGRRPRRGDGRPHRPRRRPTARAGRRAPRRMASSSSPTGTRPARSSCPASAPAIEAGAELARTLGAKRAIVLPGLGGGPLAADGRGRRRHAAVLADVAFPDPAIPLLANADAPPITTAEGCAGRARRAPDRRRRLGRGGRADGRGRRHDVHRGRPRQGPHRPHQAHRPRRRGHRRRRPGRVRPTASTWPPRPPPPDPNQKEPSSCASPTTTAASS